MLHHFERLRSNDVEDLVVEAVVHVLVVSLSLLPNVTVARDLYKKKEDELINKNDSLFCISPGCR